VKLQGKPGKSRFESAKIWEFLGVKDARQLINVLGIKDDWPLLGRIDRMLDGQERTRFGGFFVA